MRKVRDKRLPRLVWKALAAMKKQAPRPVSGQFKLCYKVAVTSTAGKTHWYALKRGASPAEVGTYHHSGQGCSPRHRTKRQGGGQKDLMREIERQELGVLPKRVLLRYRAWTWVDGVLWAVQPWSNEKEGEGVEIDDAFWRLTDCSGYVGSFNTTVHMGRLKTYDWGYEGSPHLHPDTFKKRREIPAQMEG